MICYALDDLCGTAQVGSGDFEGDDVDSCAHAIYISLVHWVPETCGVAQVCLRRHEEFERYIFGSRGIG
jgi:hypothetical protein